MDQSAHPSIHPSTKITKSIGVIRSYVVWTFSIVTVQKLPQLPTLPKYHTIFLNKHHGTYRATTVGGGADQQAVWALSQEEVCCHL